MLTLQPLAGAARKDVLGRGIRLLAMVLLAGGAAFVAPEASAAIIWSTATGGPVVRSHEVANGDVYVGSNDGSVYALRATDGIDVWKFSTGGPVNSSPDVANGLVYFGSTDGLVRALDAATGKPVWTFVTGG